MRAARKMIEFTVGVDLVDVREVEAALAAFGERYLARVYTSAEASYAREAPALTARRLGARFAAKEATLKALHGRELGISPRAIEVVRDEAGGCGIALTGPARLAARELGIHSLSLSMSQQGDIAAAVVVGLRTAPGRAAPRQCRPKSKRIRRHEVGG
jgi:holo-[acyl-carrier protein] synthase